jgi:tripartite-type tricarboxylate transporter receptor subunit TctC
MGKQTTRLPRPLWIRRAGCLTAAVLAAAALAACSTATAGSSSAKGCGTAANAPAPPAGADTSYYCGKTITFIVDDAAGSENDLYFQAVKPYVQKYLGATVKAQYYPGSAVVGSNKTATAASDGLTIGDLDINFSLNQIFNATHAEVFDVSKLSWVFVYKPDAYLIVSCKNSPYKTIAQALASTKTVTLLDIPSGGGNEILHFLMAAYGTPHKYITGYSGGNALGAGCLRGDGDITIGAPSDFLTSAGNAMDPGETPLLLSTSIPAGSSNSFLNAAAPTFAQFFKQQPVTAALGQQAQQLALSTFNSGIEGGFAGPPGIPQARLLALRAAFTYAALQPDVEKKWSDLGIAPGITANAADADSYATTKLQQATDIEKILKMP